MREKTINFVSVNADDLLGITLFRAHDGHVVVMFKHQSKKGLDMHSWLYGYGFVIILLIELAISYGDKEHKSNPTSIFHIYAWFLLLLGRISCNSFIVK